MAVLTSVWVVGLCVAAVLRKDFLRKRGFGSMEELKKAPNASALLKELQTNAERFILVWLILGLLTVAAFGS